MGYLSLVEWVDLNSFCLSCHGGWDSWDSDISWRKIEVHVVNMETTVKTVVCQPCVSMVTDPDWITHTTNSHMALSKMFFLHIIQMHQMILGSGPDITGLQELKVTGGIRWGPTVGLKKISQLTHC